MFGELTAGAVIMVFCAWGCGAIFYFIGRNADKSGKPAHFWAGSEIDPRNVSDLPSYNHANAVMWKCYSIPYWISGLLSCFAFISEAYISAGAVMLFLACLPGIPLLIRKYRQIEKTYLR